MRLPVRWMLYVAVVGLVASACGSSTSSAGAGEKTMALLFVAGSSGGSLTPISGEPGEYVLAMTAVEPTVTWFSDRPARRSGREPVQSRAPHNARWRSGNPRAVPVNGAREFPTIRRGRKDQSQWAQFGKAATDRVGPHMAAGRAHVELLHLTSRRGRRDNMGG